MWKQRRGSMKGCDLFLQFTEDVEWLVFVRPVYNEVPAMKHLWFIHLQRGFFRPEGDRKHDAEMLFFTNWWHFVGKNWAVSPSFQLQAFFCRPCLVSRTLWCRLTQLRGNDDVLRTIRAVSFALNVANVAFSLQRTSRPPSWARLRPPPLPPLFSAIPKGKSTCNYAAFVHSSDTLWDPPGKRRPHSAFLPPHMLLTGRGGRVKWRPKPAATSWVWSYCKPCRSDENAVVIWAGGAFGRWHGNIEQRFSRWIFYLWSNFYDETDIYSTWWGFCGGLPFLPVQNWLINVLNADNIKDKVLIILQHCSSCLNFCSSNQIIGPHELHKPTSVRTESQFGANLFQNASRGLSITAGDTSDIPLCWLSTHNKLITSHLCDTLFFKWLHNGKQGVSNFDDCLASWLTLHFGSGIIFETKGYLSHVVAWKVLAAWKWRR